MSKRDIARILREHKETGIYVEAVKLYREGKIRNPNDIVLHLKVHPDKAREILSKIVENEGLVVVDYSTIMETVNTLRELVERGEKAVKNLERLQGLVNESEKLKIITEGLITRLIAHLIPFIDIGRAKRVLSTRRVNASYPRDLQSRW